MANESLQRKKDFEKLRQKGVVTLSADVFDCAIKNALTGIGINNVNIFDELDELKVRLYVSELIMKREMVKLDNFADYLSVVNGLLCYAEYLGDSGKIVKPVKRDNDVLENKEQVTNIEKVSANIPDGRDKLQDSLIVAYYLSRINMKAVKELGYGCFRAAFDGLALLMGQKPATLKNMRDEFDPYFDNGRAGWYQRSLSPSRKAVFDKMINVSDEELTIIVKEIVNAYSQKAQEAQIDEEKLLMHKKIRIFSGEMKEIKTRKK